MMSMLQKNSSFDPFIAQKEIQTICVINQRFENERKLIGTNCLLCVMSMLKLVEAIANLSTAEAKRKVREIEIGVLLELKIC